MTTCVKVTRKLDTEVVRQIEPGVVKLQLTRRQYVKKEKIKS